MGSCRRRGNGCKADRKRPRARESRAERQEGRGRGRGRRSRSRSLDGIRSTLCQCRACGQIWALAWCFLGPFGLHMWPFLVLVLVLVLVLGRGLGVRRARGLVLGAYQHLELTSCLCKLPLFPPRFSQRLSRVFAPLHKCTELLHNELEQRARKG